MKKILDKTITGFFVFIFGILWFFSTKYYLKQENYNIIIYDVYGKEVKLDGIRTNFRIRNVAISYIREYQKSFPHLEFSIQLHIPKIKKRLMFNKILKKG